MYQTILFDLDGTLTDSGKGITNAVSYALAKAGIQVEDKSTLFPFIGPPLKDSFKEFYHFTEEQASQRVRDYREYYNVKGLFENEVYPGIEKLLSDIKKSGRRIGLATSKPDKLSIQILDHSHLLPYFDIISAPTMDEKRNTKIEVIEYALEQFGITDVSDIVMVGDRKFDILGAKHFGMDSIGVLYGYGSREELTEAGATYLVENTEGIWSVL